MLCVHARQWGGGLLQDHRCPAPPIIPASAAFSSSSSSLHRLPQGPGSTISLPGWFNERKEREAGSLGAPLAHAQNGTPSIWGCSGRARETCRRGWPLAQLGTPELQGSTAGFPAGDAWGTTLAAKWGVLLAIWGNGRSSHHHHRGVQEENLSPSWRCCSNLRPGEALRVEWKFFLVELF